MTAKIRANFATLRSLAHGSISGTYAAVGSAIGKRIKIIKFYNGTNQDLIYSNDSSNADGKDILPPSGFFVIDLTANKVRDDGFFFAEGETWYVKHTGSAPTSGSFYITIVEEA